MHDRRFTDLPGLLRSDDLLVFNDTRVIPARVFGKKDSGGQIELLIERFHDAQTASVQIRASKPPVAGQTLNLEGGISAVVQKRTGTFYEIRFQGHVPALELLEQIGHIPLPPYIDRTDGPVDRERYQTVYARERGAVAAPTAGLHFDRDMLDTLNRMGVDSTTITLHVAAGTFQPMRVDHVHDHQMHAEFVNVPSSACDKINSARDAGRRVVAVGTTVVRALESATHNGRVEAFKGDTNIFIYPGYRFQMIDALLTNFHLPESTLLMLVCAFGGTENVLKAYHHAVQSRYRFYSYGDAMFLSNPVGGKSHAV